MVSISTKPKQAMKPPTVTSEVKCPCCGWEGKKYELGSFYIHGSDPTDVELVLTELQTKVTAEETRVKAEFEGRLKPALSRIKLGWEYSFTKDGMRCLEYKSESELGKTLEVVTEPFGKKQEEILALAAEYRVRVSLG